jgi:hypothetical protein
MFNGKRWLSKIAEIYKGDYRSHARLRAEFAGVLSGPFGSLLVGGVDLNRNGAGVLSPESLPIGTLVFLRLNDLGRMGFAHIRHCSPRGDGFLLGLQFREGLSRDREDVGDFNVRQLAQNGCRLWDEAEA